MEESLLEEALLDNLSEEDLKPQDTKTEELPASENSSDFLKITDKELTIEGNQLSLPSEPEKITSGSKENPLKIDIDESTAFDLSIDLSLPSSNGVITLENISTGTDYKFYGQV